MRAISSIRYSIQRGITMIIALIVVAILLVVALTVLSEAISAAQNATGVANKSAAFNAAGGGLEAAIDALNHVSSTAVPSGTCTAAPTLNGITVANACVKINNASILPTTAPDPATGQTITVPAGYAYVYSNVNQTALTHRTYVEALAAQSSSASIPTGGLNGQDSICDDYNSGTTVASDMHANNAIFKCNGGASNAVGNTYGYNYDGMPGTGGATHDKNSGASLITFPSPTAMNLFKAAALEAAQSGTTMTPATAISTCTALSPCTGNVYISGDLTLSNQSVTFSGAGASTTSTIYINGNVSISGNSGFMNNAGTNATGNDVIVVSGSISITGQSFYQNLSQTGSLIIYATDTGNCVQTFSPPTLPTYPNPTGCAAAMAGNAKPAGLVYAPFGSINLQGNGNELGAFDAGTTPTQSGGAIYLNGGGVAGGFTAAPSAFHNPPSGLYAIKAYWEY
jgi:Tfp pilus assembly protein PilX